MKLRGLFFGAAAIAMLAPVGAAQITDFLKVRGTEFYLHGKPFHEISFNKVDLFWQIRAAEFQQGGFGADPLFSAENALQNLNKMGFKTIRVVFDETREYRDPEKHARFLAALDRTLDLCDKYDLRIVASVNLPVVGYPEKTGETFSEYIANPESKARKLANEYVKEIVTRYRDRKTIAIWEHGNELLLKADIGNKDGLWGTVHVPTLTQVADFHTSVAAYIRSLDSNHPITTGDSYRNTIWSLYQKGLGLSKSGDVDTMADIGKAVSMAQRGVDVFCVHNYYKGPKFGCHPVKGPGGQLVGLKMADWTAIAHATGKPFYLGEYGAIGLSRDPKNQKRWDDNPEWFESYEGKDKPIAITMVGRALNDVVQAKPNLVHWWAYQSDRNRDQTAPQRHDIDLQRNPELVGLIVEANRKLQMATMGFTYMKKTADSNGSKAQ